MSTNRKPSHLIGRHSFWVVIIMIMCCVVSCSHRRQEGPLNPVIDLGPTAVVSDLRILAITADKVTIRWTAPPWNGEDIEYRIVHSEDSLTAANWFNGVGCLNVPPLADSGVTQSYDVTGLPAGRLSYIAIRTCNANGCFGPVSRNLSGTLPSLLTTPTRYNLAGSGIATSDIDGDGDLDIVVTGEAQAGYNLHTLRNDGTGRFAQGLPLSVNGSLRLVRFADFDNDGFDDIATLSTNSLFVLTNNGLGFFSVTDSQYVGLMGDALQVGDLNRDGLTDIMVSSSFCGGKFAPCSGSLSVFFNDGHSGFDERDTVNTTFNVTDICALDADDDGDLDIAAVYSNSEVMQVNYNDGTGRRWDNRQDVNIGEPWPSITPGDLNNDGKLDLIGAGVYGRNLMAVLRMNQGGFSVTISTPGAGLGTDVHLGDFDGDGFLDVARASYGALTLHLNNGRGGFAGAARYPTGYDQCASSLEVADFDRDGHPDIAVLQNAGELVIFMSSL